ncbi:MAG: transketolase [Spirochaetaceae bacterium]|jgi:transketolase|nr:transketolase [Spirochaetaceae bacterium]
MTIEEQKEKAKRLRADIVRMVCTAKSGHPGGSLSVVEILMALYYNAAKIDPKNPQWEERDRIVLSKGHAAPAMYAVLSDLGYFPREDLWGLRKISCHLQGHPDRKKTPGIDVSTGSLGQGVAVAGGMALAAKIKKQTHRVFAIVGDGEIQEGIVWEAAMSAAHYKLDNLTVLLDHNGLQIDGANDDVMSLGNVVDKYRAFGFECISVDGHDIAAIIQAINAPVSSKPKFIECKTHKGYGISFMQDNYAWHGKAPSQEEYEKALAELGVQE